jgi:hypothetical protein
MELFLENKYSKYYFNIIENAKHRKLDNIYVEKHHIFPKSLGGKNSKENLVILTAKEHFICHLLLVKAVIYEYRKKMNYAFWRMCNVSENRYKPTSRFYEMGRSGFVESQKGHLPYLLSHTEYTKYKIGKSMSITLSKLSVEEMKERMINSCCRADVYTEERAAKISLSTTGVKKTKTPLLLKAEDDRRDRCTLQMLRCAALNKGRTWQLIEGKRVWMDRVAQNH